MSLARSTLALMFLLGGCSPAIDAAIGRRDRDAAIEGKDDGPSGTLDEWQACSLDGDVGTRTYTLSLTVPASNAIGFNIDRRATKSSEEVSGCGRVDALPDGVDNAFAEFAATSGLPLAAVGVDIPAAIASQTSERETRVELVVTHWNGAITDACVGLELRVRDDGTTRPALQSSAALSNGFIHYAYFEGQTTITPRFYLDEFGIPGECDESCQAYGLPITLQGVRARFVFGGGDGMARLTTSDAPTNDDSTILGGFVRYQGKASEGAFKPGLDAIIAVVSYVSSVSTSFPLFLDLDTAPALMPCISLGNAYSGDAFSIAFLATSE